MRIYFAVQLTWLNLFFLAYMLENMSEEKLRFFFSFKISSSSSIVGNLGLGVDFELTVVFGERKEPGGGASACG